MTTGEYLVAHSTLTSGTALQHLLALQVGTGQGTVFVSQFNVRVEQQKLVVTRMAKRRVQPAVQEVAPRQVADPKQKNVAVLRRVPTLTVLADGPEQLVITRKRR